MNEEMGKQCLLHNFKGINDIIQAVTNNSVNEYIKNRGPYVPPEHVITLSVSNMKSFPLHIPRNNPTWLISSDPMVAQLLSSAGLNRDLFSNIIREKLTDDNIYGWDELSNNEQDRMTFTMVQAISIEANRDSRAGKNVFYATHKFHNKRPRHDFVMVNMEDESQPAQVLCFLKMTNFDNSICEFYAIVRYLKLCPRQHQPNLCLNCPFTIYEWEVAAHIGRGRRRTLDPVIQMIDVSTILTPAYITPVHETTLLYPTCRNWKTTDKFWYMPTTFTDRAGWDDEDDNEENLDEEVNPDYNDVNIHIPIPGTIIATNDNSSDSDDSDDD